VRRKALETDTKMMCVRKFRQFLVNDAKSLSQLAHWQRDHAAKPTIALISRGPVESNRAEVAEHQLTHVLLQNDYEVTDAYQVERLPTAVLVSPDGTIGSGLSAGAEAIRQLVAQTLFAAIKLIILGQYI
jgi:hypothetical protein